MSFKNITWQQVTVLALCLAAMGLSYKFLGANAGAMAAVVGSVVTFLLGRDASPPSGGAAVGALSLAMLACGAADSKAMDAAYATKIEACVADAGTRAEADACRAQVKAEFGLDGGK